MRHLEVAVRAGAPGVDDAFGDPLAVEMGQEVAADDSSAYSGRHDDGESGRHVVKVLEQERALVREPLGGICKSPSAYRTVSAAGRKRTGLADGGSVRGAVQGTVLLLEDLVRWHAGLCWFCGSVGCCKAATSKSVWLGDRTPEDTTASGPELAHDGIVRCC